MSRSASVVLIALILVIGLTQVHTVAAKPGDLDPTFGTGGYSSTLMLRTTAVAGAIQADSKIVVAGLWSWTYPSGNAERFALARYRTDGTLDTSFGGNGNGTLTTNIGSYQYAGWFSYAYPNSIAIQSDGKIVVSGYAYVGTTEMWAVARYNPDGSMDSTFHGNGTVTFAFPGASYSYPDSMTIQSDGKILLVGYAYVSGTGYGFAIARLTTSGGLDSSFGSGGTTITFFGWYAYNPSYHYAYAYAVAVQPDGRIVVGGSAENGYQTMFAIARYGTNGVLDPSFGGNSNGTNVLPGSVISPNTNFYSTQQISTLAIEANGEILVGGYLYEDLGPAYTQEALMGQFHSDGTLDTTYGNHGLVVTPFVSDIANGFANLTDGSVVVSGTLRIGSINTFELARYWSNGTTDSNFGNMGTMAPTLGSNNAFAVATLIQSDGKIVVVGSVTNGMADGFIVARYLTTDTVAPTWSTGATLAASNVGQTTLTLIWTPSSDDVAVTSYKIYQGTTLLATVQGNILSYNVTGLAAGTSYKFTVQAGDAAGNFSANGPTLNVSTAPGLPLVPILVIVAIAAGFGAALFLTKPKTPKTPAPS